MNAYIKNTRSVAKVSQWCNDWFMLESDENPFIARRPWSPADLIFTKESMEKILEHKNNGDLLEWFYPSHLEYPVTAGKEIYSVTFIKNRVRKLKRK